MRLRKATFAALVVTGAAVALAIVFGGGKDTEHAKAAHRSGRRANRRSRSSRPATARCRPNHAVVVKVDLENFQLAPRQLRPASPNSARATSASASTASPTASTRKNCSEAINSPLGNERLQGASMRLSPNTRGRTGSSPNGLGTAGSYSPATRPEIYYHDLPPGFYRLIVTLAQNNWRRPPYHAVTNFQILQKPGHHFKTVRAGQGPQRQGRGSNSLRNRSASILHFV